MNDSVIRIDWLPHLVAKNSKANNIRTPQLDQNKGLSRPESYFSREASPLAPSWLLGRKTTAAVTSAATSLKAWAFHGSLHLCCDFLAYRQRLTLTALCGNMLKSMATLMCGEATFLLPLMWAVQSRWPAWFMWGSKWPICWQMNPQTNKWRKLIFTESVRGDRLSLRSKTITEGG